MTEAKGGSVGKLREALERDIRNLLGRWVRAQRRKTVEEQLAQAHQSVAKGVEDARAVGDFETAARLARDLPPDIRAELAEWLGATVDELLDDGVTRH